MFAIINNIHHLHWQISCKSVTVAPRQHDLSFACLKSGRYSVVQDRSHAPGPGCSKAFFLLFRSAAVFLKLSDNHPLGEALAMWPNKYNWFKWVMSSDKKKHWLVDAKCSLFKSVPFLQQGSKVLTEKKRISNS